jgi:hypothetical protein
MRPLPRSLVNNNLLAGLRPADLALLLPFLQQWRGRIGDVLYEPGDAVDEVFFPCGESLVSFLVVMEDGQAVETALVGREGAVGGVVSQGLLPAYARSQVRAEGLFLRMQNRDLERLKAQSPSLRNLFVRYADCLVAQIFQGVACNATHSIEQRLAKWLLAAKERTGEQRFVVSQDELAMMLGVGRAYLNKVVQGLKNRQVIATRRRALLICDEAALEQAACGCNAAFREHFETVLKGIYPDEDG